MMKRRSFLGAMLAACAAPAIVKAEVLMPVRAIATPSMVIATGLDEVAVGVDYAYSAGGAAYVVFMHPSCADEIREMCRPIERRHFFEGVEVRESPKFTGKTHELNESWWSAPDDVRAALNAEPVDITKTFAEYAKLQRIAKPLLSENERLTREALERITDSHDGEQPHSHQAHRPVRFLHRSGSTSHLNTRWPGWHRVAFLYPAQGRIHMQIEPTVGRTVYFEPGTTTPPGMSRNPAPAGGSAQPFMAFVNYVHSPSMVNLTVIDHAGTEWPLTSVPFKNDPDAESPTGSYAYWMPYQIGQAIKQADTGRMPGAGSVRSTVELVKLSESTATGEPQQALRAPQDDGAVGDLVDAEAAQGRGALSPGENTVGS